MGSPPFGTCPCLVSPPSPGALLTFTRYLGSGSKSYTTTHTPSPPRAAIHNFPKFHAQRSELSSVYFFQANSRFLQGPGARLLTVGVSTDTVLKSPRGLTVPALFPARRGRRVPRRVRPQEWSRCPLPGSASCSPECPIAREPQASRPQRAPGGSEGASPTRRSRRPGSAQPRPAPPTQWLAAQRPCGGSGAQGSSLPSKPKLCVRRLRSSGPAEGLWPQTLC